jgi:hypothetical protein
LFLAFSAPIFDNRQDNGFLMVLFLVARKQLVNKKVLKKCVIGKGVFEDKSEAIKWPNNLE